VSAPPADGLSSGRLVRLVAAREVSTRVRDKTFVISSVIILLLVIGAMAFQVVLASSSSQLTVGVVGDQAVLAPVLHQEARTVGAEVTVVGLPDEAAARRAVKNGDVDGALLGGTGPSPELVVDRSADSRLQAVVQGGVGQLALGRALARAGVGSVDVPRTTVTALAPDADQTGERTGVAIIAVVILYTLLVLFSQFVAQGVVEEKSTRVVELLLATLRPWQLLAGKILGLGLLGLVQIVVVAVIGVVGAVAFGVVSFPAHLIGTVVAVVAWFVLGYAFYAAVFAAAASLVSRQEDLPSVITPTSMLLFAGLFISIRAATDPTGGLARVTSFIPGLSPLVMPVRQAAGGLAWWEVLVAVVLMLAGIAVVVRLGGRIYAGALLRTSGRIKIREALQGERS
jgi:ABC-2 type transport system permease protein